MGEWTVQELMNLVEGYSAMMKAAERGDATEKQCDEIWDAIRRTATGLEGSGLKQEIDVVRKQRDAWWDTAYERMLLLQEAREFVIAYMKQCDVPCGIQGADVLLGKINQTVADLRSNAELT